MSIRDLKYYTCFIVQCRTYTHYHTMCYG